MPQVFEQSLFLFVIKNFCNLFCLSPRIATATVWTEHASARLSNSRGGAKRDGDPDPESVRRVRDAAAAREEEFSSALQEHRDLRLEAERRGFRADAEAEARAAAFSDAWEELNREIRQAVSRQQVKWKKQSLKMEVFVTSFSLFSS